MEKLRFAPLVRVSTEKQEKMGESLRTQQAQIQQAVKALSGVLIPDPWRYSGQEHATPGFEKKRFDQLLKDAGRGLFDAVIVCDPSRWSRDNLKSSQGLEILKQNGIRFFAGQIEHDLFDPTSELFLGMTTQINQYQAKISAQKSLRNKIARARRNIPTSGKLPHGRTFDKKTETWGIDLEKQKKIEWAAKQYLKGVSSIKLAKHLGMSHHTFWTTLAKRSGPTWEIQFRSEQHNIDQKVTLNVPQLLDEETIKAIRTRIEANRTYLHGQIKYQYLLGRIVFCARCGYALFGHTNIKNNVTYRYYRHIQKGLRQKECDPRLSIPANELEEAILTRLFIVLGDEEGMRRAIERAVPNRTKIEELRERKKFLESELSKTEARKNRFIDYIGDGLLSKAEAKAKMEDVRLKEASIKTEIDAIDSQLVDMPTAELTRHRARLIELTMERVFRSPSRLKRMSFEERRELVKSFFSGKDTKGQRWGVYVAKDSKGAVNYEIRGMFQTFQDQGTLGEELPIDLPYLERIEEVKEAAKGEGWKKESVVGRY